MVSAGAVVGILILMAIHIMLAAIGTRFIRLYVETRTGEAIAILLVIPTLLFFSTLLLSGVFHLGFDLQDRWLAAMIAIVIPFALGLTIDYLWVASPEEVEQAIAD